MLIQIMKSKIHRVKITQADVDYIGSITIDPVLMKAANIIAGEKVQVLNISNGERLETYVIEGEQKGETKCEKKRDTNVATKSLPTKHLPTTTYQSNHNILLFFGARRKRMLL